MHFLQTVRRLTLPVILFLLLALPVHASCDHLYVRKLEAPTCTEGGLSWLECIHCGDTIDYSPIDALGHTFGDWYILEGPTCTRDGVQAQECTVCGHQQTAPIPPAGHIYEPQVRQPTCTAGGYTRYNCCACSSYYIAEYTNPLGHRYDSGVLIREPTDTTQGEVRFTCIRCIESYRVYYRFRDIDSNAYYFTPVIWSKSRGITSGLDEAHFGPDAVCNRAQVVTFLWRAAGRPVFEDAVNPFCDVPADSFYEEAVLWAYQSGITTGTDAVHFSPAAPCNRAQVVTFLHRFRGCPEPTAATVFPDVPADSFYHSAVLWAAQREITLGMDGGLFCPEKSCTRAQIVTFLYRDEYNP